MRHQTGVDYTQHVPPKHHLEPSGAVCSLIMCWCLILIVILTVLYTILTFGVMDKLSYKPSLRLKNTSLAAECLWEKVGTKDIFTIQHMLQHSMLPNELIIKKEEKTWEKDHLIDFIEQQKGSNIFCNMKKESVITTKCCRCINTELFFNNFAMDLLLLRAVILLHLPISEMCQKKLGFGESCLRIKDAEL